MKENIRMTKSKKKKKMMLRKMNRMKKVKNEINIICLF